MSVLGKKAMKAIAVVSLAALTLTGCTAGFTEDSQASVILRVTGVTSSSGGGGAGSGIDTSLNSDVSTNGGIFNDNATVSFQVTTKNPRVAANAGVFNDVTLERYEVNYIRSDGRNVEGVDVPFRITGLMSLLIPAGGNGDASIIVVRHQAKFEPPLKNLQGLGGSIIFTCFAEITFHGRTTSGAVVTATARLQINFADFADS